ncbi:hypothetical protein CBER1_08182 [Cercospora berteroae]|uniref:DUF7708 domain-containing protein n=1 Tax=Cercospora berteroae TaxID=357750 RepID=A0A2S6BUU8_9PEZI|nr:hypothetical protein CBER1_08182 [Cercospora berteroae]
MPSPPSTAQRWFTNQSQRERCFREANDLWDDREAWTKETLGDMKDSRFSSRETLLPLTRKSSSLETIYSSSKDDLDSQIIWLDPEESGPENDLAKRTEQQLLIATSSMSQWRARRKSGTGRKIATGVQGFLVTFSDFLESFSGIVEVVKAADQQYGGFAYGTMSVLLSVVVHKDKRENDIEDALEELTYAFPRLAMLRSLQPSDRLQDLIADVFGLVVKFARETTDYFSSRRQRWKDAVSPGKVKMQTMSRIRRQLGQVKQESDTLLLQDISKMKQTIDDMSVRLRSTQSIALAHKSSADGEYLASIRRTLGIKVEEPYTFNTDLERYKVILGRAFHNRRAIIRAPMETSLHLLTEDADFAQWLTKQESSLLLLGGQNWHRFDSKDLVWLSEGSVLLAESLRSQLSDTQKVAWFLCQTDWTMTDRKKCSVQDVMASLIYQIVLMHADKLRDYHDQVQRVVEGSDWRSDSAEKAFGAFAGLLANIIAHFDDNFSLTIILDRLDQCRWHDEPDQEGWNMRFAVEGFLEVMEAVQCCVKFMIVVDTAAAMQLSSYASRKRLVMKQNWQQESRR